MRSALALAVGIAVCGVLGMALIAGGCLSKPKFECSNAAECISGTAQGTCQMDGFCSFADSSCPSGQRYGDLSGPQANECVPLPPDGPPDAYVYDARECFGSGAYQLCFGGMPPMGDLTLSGNIDTAIDPRCVAMPASWAAAGQPDACLIMGKKITINGTTAVGVRPLVILGDTITINGVLDVSSHRGQPAGPGAPFGTCPTFGATPAVNAAGAGGGAGASFKTRGGDGGDGKSGSAGGTSQNTVGTPPLLRGGCLGQTGGTGGGPSGTPGQGGGAVFLTASKITFGANGAINASGAGGSASSLLSGGAGGGSGGMIVMHAVEGITASTGARVLANGGGGASGAAGAGAGSPGNDPSAGSPTTQAAGGVAAGNQAGDGGGGAAGGSSADDGEGAGGSRDTGGGGGGGHGYILATSTNISGLQTSPNITLMP